MTERYDIDLENMPEPDNRGKKWDADDYARLEKLFANGRSLREISLELGRTPSGVLSKLYSAKLVYFDARSRRYFKFNDETVSNLFGDVRLNDISVEVSAFIDGKNLNEMSSRDVDILLERLETKHTMLLDFCKKYEKNIAILKKFIAFKGSSPTNIGKL